MRPKSRLVALPLWGRRRVEIVLVKLTGKKGKARAAGGARTFIRLQERGSDLAAESDACESRQIRFFGKTEVSLLRLNV